MIEKSATRIIEPSAAIVRQSGRGCFLVVKGPDRGESVTFGEFAMTLGSGPGSDVLLSDPTVSRRHLVVEPRDDGVVVSAIWGRPTDRSFRARAFRS